MKYTLKKENGYSYLESGTGTPLIILHGLMGNLSNFDSVFDHFSELGYQVIMPELPLYTMPLLKTNVKNLSKFVKDFVKFKGLDNYILMGNSLGGHIALYHAKINPKNVSGLVLTGSSGLMRTPWVKVIRSEGITSISKRNPRTCSTILPLRPKRWSTTFLKR